MLSCHTIFLARDNIPHPWSFWANAWDFSVWRTLFSSDAVSLCFKLDNGMLPSALRRLIYSSFLPPSFLFGVVSLVLGCQVLSLIPSIFPLVMAPTLPIPGDSHLLSRNLTFHFSEIVCQPIFSIDNWYFTLLLSSIIR